MAGARMRDFPTSFIRFWYALGVRPIINPPQTPEKNAFAERLHRTIEHEYILRQCPQSLEAIRETLPAFQHHYNTERPHQGVSCGNLPPGVAHPAFPERRPLPAEAEPDRWLVAYDGRAFARRINPSGSLVLDGQNYYVDRRWAGQSVVAQLHAADRTARIWVEHRLVHRVPLKGLVGHPMRLDAFVQWCVQEARAMWRVAVSQRARSRLA